MGFKTVKKETERIEKFLLGRDWEIGRQGIGAILENAEREIERIQQHATNDILRALASYEKEAQRGADNKVFTLWEQEHVPLSKREQQASATDARHIHAAIVQIGEVE